MPVLKEPEKLPFFSVLKTRTKIDSTTLTSVETGTPCSFKRETTVCADALYCSASVLCRKPVGNVRHFVTHRWWSYGVQGKHVELSPKKVVAVWGWRRHDVKQTCWWANDFPFDCRTLFYDYWYVLGFGFKPCFQRFCKHKRSHVLRAILAELN